MDYNNPPWYFANDSKGICWIYVLYVHVLFSHQPSRETGQDAPQSNEATMKAQKTSAEESSDYEPPPAGLVPPKPCVLATIPVTRHDRPVFIRTAA